MRTEWIIVDGYNMIHQEEDGGLLLQRDLYLARQRLIRNLEAALPSLADRITAVFDGSDKIGGIDDFEPSPVEVVFSRSGLSADTMIEQMVAESASPQKILVVTSDRLESNAVSGSGAETVSCATFIDRLRSLKHRVRPQIDRLRARGPLGSLGDFFPKE